jgi:hypothetical protein
MEAYLQLKEMHDKRPLLDEKIKKKLEMLEQVRNDKTMEFGRQMAKRQSMENDQSP